MENTSGKKKKITQDDIMNLLFDLKSGETIKIFESISQAGRESNNSTGNITAVCKGKRPHAGGYGWRYDGEQNEE